MISKNNTKSTNSIDKNIGAKIGEYRVARGMTRKELGKLIGITHQQLQKYEKGINRITVGRLLDIASVLKVTTSEILNDLNKNIDIEQIEKNRIFVDTLRDFAKLENRIQQETIRDIIKALAERQ